MPGDKLDREDLIHGINSLITKLHDSGEPAGIRIVGGAALALRYFDRRTTSDIDAHLHPEGSILDFAIDVAREVGWPEDWLNSNAAMFIPLYSPAMEWEELFSKDNITVAVAAPKSLLAMKINASRPGRDVQDIANLLSICKLKNISEVYEMMDIFYPGDGLSEKALRILIPIFEQGLPAIPMAPPKPSFRLN